MARARQAAETSVVKIRDMVLLLRPSMLDDLGLVPALKRHAGEISRREGSVVEVAADGRSEVLPNEYRTCICRFVREAMRNAARKLKPPDQAVKGMNICCRWLGRPIAWGLNLVSKTPKQR